MNFSKNLIAFGITCLISMPAFAQNDASVCCRPDPIADKTATAFDIANTGVFFDKSEKEKEKTEKNLKKIASANMTESLTSKYSSIFKQNYSSHRDLVVEMCKPVSSTDPNDDSYTYVQLKKAVLTNPEAAYKKLFADMIKKNKGIAFEWMNDPFEVEMFKKTFTAVAAEKGHDDKIETRDEVIEKIAADYAKKATEGYKDAAKNLYLKKGKAYDDMVLGISNNKIGAVLSPGENAAEAAINLDANYADAFGCVTSYKESFNSKSGIAPAVIPVKNKGPATETEPKALPIAEIFECKELEQAFPNNSYQVTAESKSVLDKCLNKFQEFCKKPKNVKVQIQACASTLRPDLKIVSSNLELSRNRAKAVQQIFVDAKIPGLELNSQNFTVDGDGENRDLKGNPTGTCGGAPPRGYGVEAWMANGNTWLTSGCKQLPLLNDCNERPLSEKWKCLQEPDPNNPNDPYAQNRRVTATFSAECEPKRAGVAPSESSRGPDKINVSNKTQSAEPLYLQERQVLCLRPALFEKNKSSGSSSGPGRVFIFGDGLTKKRNGGPRMCPWAD